MNDWCEALAKLIDKPATATQDLVLQLTGGGETKDAAMMTRLRSRLVKISSKYFLYLFGM